MLDRRTVLNGSVASLATLAISRHARAQAPYPSRPVKLVVTDPPGAAIDVVTRTYADRLSPRLGAQFIVENRAGGTGLLAAQAVVNAEPDGYTLLAAAGSTFIVLPAQKEKLPVNLSRDLLPIGLFGELPQVIAISSHIDLKDLAELIAQAKQEPTRFFCGTNGSGTFPHLTAKRFVEVSGAPITVVPYAAGGTSEVMRDVLGGRIQLVISSLSALKGLIQSGDIRPLAIAARERLSNFPAWPTIAETLPDFTAVGWSALLAPAHTPDAIIQQLNAAMRAVAQDPDSRSRLQDLGTYPRALSAAQLRTFIEAEQTVWWPIVKANAQQQVGK